MGTGYNVRVEGRLEPSCKRVVPRTVLTMGV